MREYMHKIFVICWYDVDLNQLHHVTVSEQ